jgi:hypothetical protein
MWRLASTRLSEPPPSFSVTMFSSRRAFLIIPGLPHGRKKQPKP